MPYVSHLYSLPLQFLLFVYLFYHSCSCSCSRCGHFFTLPQSAYSHARTGGTAVHWPQSSSETLEFLSWRTFPTQKQRQRQRHVHMQNTQTNGGGGIQTLAYRHRIESGFKSKCTTKAKQAYPFKNKANDATKNPMPTRKPICQNC